MPAFTPISFNPRPKEAQSLYNGFLEAKNLKDFKSCYQENKKTLLSAAKSHKIDPELLGALLFVETRCGKITGKELVFYRLARLASIAEPKNIEWNLDRLSEEIEAGEYTTEEVRARAKLLEEKFLPELTALRHVSSSMKVPLLEIRGSSAGAIGIPQFLPSSYLRFALDANKNGRISLFEFEDAAHSAANYLSLHGLRAGDEHESLMKALWAYNRSIPYGETIISVADTVRDAVESKKNES